MDAVHRQIVGIDHRRRRAIGRCPQSRHHQRGQLALLGEPAGIRDDRIAEPRGTLADAGDGIAALPGRNLDRLRIGLAPDAERKNSAASRPPVRARPRPAPPSPASYRRSAHRAACRLPAAPRLAPRQPAPATSSGRERTRTSRALPARPPVPAASATGWRADAPTRRRRAQPSPASGRSTIPWRTGTALRCRTA